MVTSNLYLVDCEGVPLAPHIVKAVEEAQLPIKRRFAKNCDPAELSCTMEDGARRVAQHEREHGPLRDTSSFTLRTLINAAISLTRKREREASVPPETIEHMAGMGRNRSGSPEAIWARIESKEAWEELSERDRKMSLLELQGFTVEEIATYLNITKDAVTKSKSRRLAKLAAKSATTTK